MTMQIDDIQAFVWVAYAGSLSAAARDHNVPKATLSLRLARLEGEVGSLLLSRSSGGMKLTEAGHSLLTHALEVTEAHQRAMDAITGISPTLKGRLRIGVTEQLATNLATPLALQFAEVETDIELDLKVMPIDRLLHRDAELDCMICGGLPTLEEGATLMARGFCRYSSHLYASPRYLARRGTPTTPATLSGHDIIGADIADAQHGWQLRRGDEVVNVHPSSGLTTNDEWVAKVCVLQDRGISLFPDFFAEEHLQSGELVAVLPDWGTEPASVTVLYHPHRFQNAHIRVFIDFICDRFQGFYSYPYRREDVMPRGRPGR